MKHTDFCSLYSKIHQHEITELKRAIGAHGGEYEFNKDDLVMVYADGFDGIQRHHIISVRATEGGATLLTTYNEEIDVHDVLVQELAYLIDCISETESVSDVTLNFE